MTDDGCLILRGRIEGSTQIKLAGIRVDLQDIEATILQACPGVSQVVVSARRSSESEDSTPFVVAFVVLSNTGAQPSEKARILEDLPRSLPLPQHLKPAVAVGVDHLPVNSSHKLDRRAVDGWPLPMLAEDAQGPSHNGDDLDTGFEVALRQLWQEALPEGVGYRRGQSINGSSDFFHVGGSSLGLINLQGLIKERLGLSMSLYKLFQNSTLKAMGALLHGQEATVTESNPAIDWEREVALPSDLTQQSDTGAQTTAARHEIKTIALTGATGFIGREILRRLLADDRISSVYCLAVRKEKSDLPTLFNHPKVVVYRGDLRAPRLGLSEEDVAATFGGDGGVQAVIHAGADVSFLKTYHTLRLVNVASTRELVRLAAPRRLPLHFISSATVARLALEAGRSSFGRESVAGYPPATARAAVEGGYVSAKWVSEVLLERAAKNLGLPVWIHRPTSVSGEDASELDLMSNITKYVQETKAIPNTREWSGGFDFVSVQSVGRDVVREVLDNAVLGGEVRYQFQSGEVEIGGDEMQSILELGTGASFEVLPLAQWIERAEKAGLNHLLALYLRRAAEGQLLIPKLLKD
ncbi:SDR family oxidoreductase [Candidatus Bathyarchaeota archaeon]|nr:SDR family oxidoreductase [Candidatus Bathyarchaeota archaeon]